MSPWTDAFTRSRIGPNIFFVRDGWESAALSVARSLPGAASDFDNRMFGYLSHDVAFGDGGLLHRDHPYIALGEYLDGTWVVGVLSLRLLVDALDLLPPRRLKEELRVPSSDQLSHQRVRAPGFDPDMQYRLEQMIGIHLSSQLREFAFDVMLAIQPDSD